MIQAVENKKKVHPMYTKKQATSILEKKQDILSNSIARST